MKKMFVLAVAVASLLSACATYQPKLLNLSYSPNSQLQKNDIKIAVVKPRYTMVQQQTQALSGAFLGAMLENKMPPDYRLKSKYSKDYIMRIEHALTTDIEKILTSKGFSVVKTYDNADEITFSEKKNISLIVQPEFDLGPIFRNEHTCFPLFGCTDKGSINMTGGLAFIATEPMSKEKIVIKKLDLSSSGMTISKEYGDGSDAENTLIDLINSTYPMILTKIEKVIDVDEINQSLNDIKNLKLKAQ